MFLPSLVTTAGYRMALPPQFECRLLLDTLEGTYRHITRMHWDRHETRLGIVSILGVCSLRASQHPAVRLQGATISRAVTWLTISYSLCDVKPTWRLFADGRSPACGDGDILCHANTRPTGMAAESQCRSRVRSSPLERARTFRLRPDQHWH